MYLIYSTFSVFFGLGVYILCVPVYIIDCFTGHTENPKPAFAFVTPFAYF